ncbi:MFS transporter [Geomonas propionica]|uniref:MFS transporter n=1 Tax=Geomonas propionica TaxID=2798582 RepID=UPI002E2E3CD9|nr:MFS transporter [Geomonas propionica]
MATAALGVFSCFGLARYAYSVLLPGMQTGLGLTYDRMGFIGTGNFVGYLLSVLAAPRLMKRLKPRRMAALGLLIIGAGMIAIGASSSLAAIIPLYALVGMGSGFTNIPLMALVTYWFRSEQRGKAAGLVIAGNGIGIILAGLLIPFLNRTYGALGWRSGWIALGAICLIVAGVAALLLRNHPSDLDLEPVGRKVAPSPEQFLHHEHKGDGRVLCHLGMLYLVFGVTFMVYGTFIVTTMVKEYGLTEAQAGLYWSWVGFFSFFSGIGFGTLSDKIGRKRGLALVFAVQSAAYLLAGMKVGTAGLIVSLILYGSTVFAIPAIMAAAVGEYLGLNRASSAFATITIFFGVGQVIGPAGAGIIAKASGAFTMPYLISGALTAVALVCALLLPPPRERVE